MVFLNSEDNVPHFQFEGLTQFTAVRHAVFTRQGGVSPAPFSSLNLSVSVADEKERVYANRRRAYGIFGRDTSSVVHAHLVHEAQIARVSQENNGTWLAHTDGIVTNEPGCALTMNYADCAPVFIYDPINHAIGLGHAGWKGAVVDLPGAMVRKMTAEFGSDPATLTAAIGPAIGPCCYEVDQPLTGQVHQTFPEAADLLIDSPHGQPQVNGGRPHFDLPRANRVNLQRAGVEQIIMSGLCTACHTEFFFSHRAEKGTTGRFGVIIILD